MTRTLSPSRTITRNVTRGVTESFFESVDPATFPNLFLHMDASDETSIASTGDNVTSWSDLSGNGRTLTVGTGTPTTGLNTVNSRNVITFALSDRLEWTNSTALTNFTDGPHEKIIICVLTDTLQQGIVLHSAGTSGERSQLYLNSSSAGNDPAYRYGNSPAFYDVDGWPAIDTNAHVFGGFHDGTNAGAWADGSTGTPAAKATVTCDSAHQVGSSSFVGHVCEILWYSRNLSTTERAQIYSHAKTKWGVA